jgi:hypothetical protein
MTLLRQLRRLRPWIGPEREYAIRRGAYGFLPVRHRSCNDVVAHACLWKTASQWVRLILSDPRVYMRSGLKPLPYYSFIKPWTDPEPVIPKQTLVTNLYLDFDIFRSLVEGRRWAAIFVIRDPRDILISWYFSTRYSHIPLPKVMENRARLEKLSERDGILTAIDDFDEFAGLMTSWMRAAQQDPRILVCRFEDLTGPASLSIWQAILRHYDIAVPESTLRSLLELYRFQNLRSRKYDAEVPEVEKYRSGRPGDWIRYFDDEIRHIFMTRYGHLVRDAGYQI